MEDQIVKSLLEFYKEQGTDLYAVLDDPLFEKLPLEEKIRLLKKHSNDIIAGTKKDMSKEEIRNILLEAGLFGMGAGMMSASTAGAVANNFSNARIPYKYLALGALAAGGLGAATSVMTSRNLINKRKTLVEKLRELQDTPTDNNAIKLLALRNQQVHPNTHVHQEMGAMTKKLLEKIKEMPAHIAFTLIPSTLGMETARSQGQNLASVMNPHTGEIRTLTGENYAEELGKELSSKQTSISPFSK